MQRILLLIVLIILFCMGIINSNVYAQTNSTRIYAKYDAVLAINHTTTIIDIWSSKNHLALDSLSGVGDFEHYPIGSKSGTSYFSYFIFPSSSKPPSYWWNSVTINSIELNALLDNIDAENQTFVSLYDCQMNSSWYRAFEKDSITEGGPLPQDAAAFDQAVKCMQNSAQHLPFDSVIVKRNDLPSFYKWDLTTNVVGVLNRSPITLLLVASPETTRTYGSPLPDSLLSVRPVYESAYLGRGVIPSLTVTYAVEPSQLYQSMFFLLTVVLPASAALIPAIIWLLRREIKRTKPTTVQK